MSTSQVARCAALLLCLLGAALATVPGRPTVMDVRAGWAGRSNSGFRGGAKTSVASASASQYYDDPSPVPYEQKEVCLQEVAARGCADSWTNQLGEEFAEYFEEFFDDGFDLDDCADDQCTSDIESALNGVLFFNFLTRGYDLLNSVWTSDFTCCDDDKYGHTAHSSVGDHVWGSTNAVGSCDWMINWVNFGVTLGDIFGGQDDDVLNVGVEISNNFRKMGAASAVCYFGADSHCGGPLCERVVMSLDGHVYDVADVYSHWAPVATGCQVPGDPNIFLPLPPVPPRANAPRQSREADKAKPDGASSPGKAAWRKFLDHQAGRKANSTRAHLPTPDLHEKLQTRSPWAARRKHQKAPAAQPGGTPAVAIPRPSAEQASTQNYDSGDDNRPALRGSAAVINGIVSSMAGPQKEKWDSGVFEYVLNFFPGDDDTGTSAINPNLPWVRDKAYKFTFYRLGETHY